MRFGKNFAGTGIDRDFDNELFSWDLDVEAINQATTLGLKLATGNGRRLDMDGLQRCALRVRSTHRGKSWKIGIHSALFGVNCAWQTRGVCGK